MNSEFDFWSKRVEDYLLEVLIKPRGFYIMEDLVKELMPVVEAYALHVSDMEAAGDDL